MKIKRRFTTDKEGPSTASKVNKQAEPSREDASSNSVDYQEMYDENFAGDVSLSIFQFFFTSMTPLFMFNLSAFPYF